MNEVRGVYEEGKLTIFLSGHIDSNNAPQVELEVNSLLEGQDIKEVMIDAAELEYISSAGLRVLLHIRKLHSGLHIINARTEVYEILDMTGFTQIIPVEKAYKEVSIEGCEIIGHGANGKLYRIDKDNVVKVYKNADALEDIRHEREMARIALIMGIPTAISYDVVKVNGSYGSVFELLNASSFANILIDEPERFDWCVKEFTDMLNKIHSTVAPKGKLPDIKQTALNWAFFLKDYLPQADYEKLRRLISQVPQDDHMIHGDYHIKNLELQNDEVLLIDMDTLAVGHPIFELGSMYNAFKGFSEYDHSNVENFLGIKYETAVEFWHKVLARYLSTDDPAKIKEVEDKARILGYCRMIRRAIRRNGLEDEKKRVEIELWKSELIELLGQYDTLLFNRDEIELEAKDQKLDEVLKFVDDHLKSAGCDPKTQMQIDIAVEELFINVARYAYAPATGNVTVRFETLPDPKCCVITLTDSGKPFDPLAKEDPDTTLSAEERQIGGLGIYMAKKNMDDIQYEYADGKNRLTIKKYIL